VSIAVTDEYMDRFDEVVRECKKAGLRVEYVLPTLGVITGTISPEKRAALERVKSVKVESSRQIQLAPPSSDVQ